MGIHNPFRYLAGADVYFFMSSEYEAASVACLESAVLEIPVISTACCAAEELIEEQNFGMVCENSEKGLYEMLTGVLEDRTCLDRFRKAPGENDVNRMPEEQLKELVLIIQRDF